MIFLRNRNKLNDHSPGSVSILILVVFAFDNSIIIFGNFKNDAKKQSFVLLFIVLLYRSSACVLDMIYVSILQIAENIPEHKIQFLVSVLQVSTLYFNYIQNSLNNIYNFAICFQVSENSQTNFFTEQKHSSKFHGAGRSEQNCNLCTYLHYMHANTQNLISFFFSNKKVILIDFQSFRYTRA